MTSYYSSVNATNNTEGNRNILLNILNTDPRLNIYNALDVISLNDDYTIRIDFENAVSFEDQVLLQKIIDINFNDSSADNNPPRSVITTNQTPSQLYDYTYNFNIGSMWLVSDDLVTYINYNNSEGSAVWVISPPMGLTGGVGLGATGDIYPYDGSILQYDDPSGLWIAQPGKWKSIDITATTMLSSGSNSPIFSNFIGNVGTYLFDSSVVRELYFNVSMPHDYREGSDIIPTVHYSPTSGSTGNIVWGLEYTWSNANDNFNTPSTITTTTDNNNAANLHLITDFSPISGNDKKISSILVCRIFRDVADINDTYPNDVSLLSIEFKYETFGAGSNQHNIK